MGTAPNPRTPDEVNAYLDRLGARPHEDAVAMIEIGHKDEMLPRHAREAADATMKIAKRHPDALFVVTVSGYDDDPREVLDIPEAVEQFRIYGARLAELVARKGCAMPRLDNNARMILLVARGIVSRECVGVG